MSEPSFSFPPALLPLRPEVPDDFEVVPEAFVLRLLVVDAVVPEADLRVREVVLPVSLALLPEVEPEAVPVDFLADAVLRVREVVPPAEPELPLGLLPERPVVPDELPVLPPDVLPVVPDELRPLVPPVVLPDPVPLEPELPEPDIEPDD